MDEALAKMPKPSPAEEREDEAIRVRFAAVALHALLRNRKATLYDGEDGAKTVAKATAHLAWIVADAMTAGRRPR